VSVAPISLISAPSDGQAFEADCDCRVEQRGILVGLSARPCPGKEGRRRENEMRGHTASMSSGSDLLVSGPRM